MRFKNQDFLIHTTQISLIFLNRHDGQNKKSLCVVQMIWNLAGMFIIKFTQLESKTGGPRDQRMMMSSIYDLIASKNWKNRIFMPIKSVFLNQMLWNFVRWYKTIFYIPCDKKCLSTWHYLDDVINKWRHDFTKNGRCSCVAFLGQMSWNLARWYTTKYGLQQSKKF